MASAISCNICHDCNQMLRYFHVPSDPARLQEWSDLLNMEFKTSSIVCEKHFLEEHITKNLELNCWRINSKAIPTLHLTDEQIADFKLIDEDDFDKNEHRKGPKAGFKNVGIQTKKFQHTQTAGVLNCLWCDDCFDTPNLYDILKHFKSKHRCEIEYFFEDVEDELKSSIVRIEDNCGFEEIQIETNTINGSNSVKFSELDDENENNASVSCFAIEECNVKNEMVVNSNQIDEEGNIDEILNIDTEPMEFAPLDNMLQNGEESFNQINIETSDESLIFFIIELLQSNPTLWFINGFKSNEYEAGLKNFCIQFSERYQFFTTQLQLHEHLIEIRDWYQSVFAQKTFEQLTYPQNEYFRQLAVFLPDKPDGKTCELCERFFNDHVQYFAHQKLEHAELIAEENEQTEQLVLEYLKAQVNDYFYARYPLRQGGFSYECQVCPTKYGRACKRVFLEHIKKHLDIRDHVCDICGKAFIKQERFQIHRKRHFGLHKSICKICGKEFTNFSLLTAHRKRYHRPIEGTIEEIEQLERQRKLHKSQIYYVPIQEGNQTIYGCPFCEKTYRHKSGVHQHCKFVHKNKISVKSRTKRSKEEKPDTCEEHSSDTEIDM